MEPFCIIGTPRSRTTWFSKFLTYDGVICDHEPSKFWKNNDDMNAFFRAGRGAADSGLTLKRHELDRLGVKMIAIIRDADDVVKSLHRVGLFATRGLVNIFADRSSFAGNIKIYDYNELDYHLPEIFKWATGQDCPPNWLKKWQNTIVNPDIGTILNGVDVPSSMNFYLGE